MKRIIYSILFCILGLASVQAQDVKQNYILTRTMLDEGGSRFIETVQYYDGLGRPFQTVQKGATPSGSNLITLQEYDVFGRESNAWLPVVSAANFLPASDFKTQAANYYGNGERPYGTNEYESSPLKRILKVYGPGAAWSDHPATTDYLINTASGELSCKNYKVSESGTLVDKGNYASGQLYILKSADEDNRIAYVFTDMLGRQLLSRQMSGNEYHDTYFVYDDLGNQRFVLPPAYKNEADLPLYAYQYKFDGRNRCIEKKLPGCDPIYYVYDRADRIVFSQDGVQREHQEWTFYLYDAFGRPTVQGICKNQTPTDASGSIVICSLAKEANRITPTGLANSGYSSSYELTSPVVHLVNYYDHYDFLSLPGFENRTNYPEATVNATGLPTGKVVYQLAEQDRKLCSALYYDPKGRAVRTVEDNYRGENETILTEYTFTGNPSRITHIHTAYLSTTQTELSTYSYDHYDRISKVTHKLNSYPEVTLHENVYDDLGRLQSKRFHGNDALQNHYTYNIRNWLTSISGNQFRQELHYTDIATPQYNGNISSMNWRSYDESVSRRYDFNYDALNRLTAANYRESTTRDGAFTTAYAYDKMGNMTSLRRYGLAAQPFRFDVIDALTIEHNGNQLRRVTDAVSCNDPLYNGAFNFVDGADAEVEYEYDKNGNLIKDMNKNITMIDYNALNLPEKITLSDQRYIYYRYSADGILLRKEHYYKDESTSIIPMPGVDPGKPGLEVKPDKPIGGGGFVQLASPHAGSDNTAFSLPSGTQTNPNLGIDMGDAVPAFYKGYVSTDYCGNVIYETGILKRILTSEGYITISNKVPTYHYYFKDHLGNNRVVADQNGTIEEVNHYYPFGGLFGESTNVAKQPYKFGGKEFDRMHGLDWYNFEARMKGDWFFPTPDPLCEKYYSISPYAYCNNNPIANIDPTGCDWIRNRFGSYLWDGNATDQESTKYGWEYVGTELPSDIDASTSYKVLVEINGNLYHKNSHNILLTTVNSVFGTNYLTNQRYDPEGDHMMSQFVETGTEFAAGAIGGKIVSKGLEIGLLNITKAETKGGLNLFKWGAEQTSKSAGWKIGDYMLYLPNKGTPRANWKANYSALRREMKLNKPIYDTYQLPNGELIPTTGFLNAERLTLQSRGWIYYPNKGAWLPPCK